MHTLDYSHISLRAEDIYRLIEALQNRITPEAHSAGIAPINHLTIDHYRGKTLRDDQNVLIKYKLGQLVPNLVIRRPEEAYDVTMLVTLELSFDALSLTLNLSLLGFPTESINYSVIKGNTV